MSDTKMQSFWGPGGSALCPVVPKGPAVQSIFCLCDILDCSLPQSTDTSVITITSLLLSLPLDCLPGYCAVGLLSPHSA